LDSKVAAARDSSSGGALDSKVAAARGSSGTGAVPGDIHAARVSIEGPGSGIGSRFLTAGAVYDENYIEPQVRAGAGARHTARVLAAAGGGLPAPPPPRGPLAAPQAAAAPAARPPPPCRW
jgi:hypothetical protein